MRENPNQERKHEHQEKHTSKTQTANGARDPWTNPHRRTQAGCYHLHLFDIHDPELPVDGNKPRRAILLYQGLYTQNRSKLGILNANTAELKAQQRKQRAKSWIQEMSEQISNNAPSNADLRELGDVLMAIADQSEAEMRENENA